MSKKHFQRFSLVAFFFLFVLFGSGLAQEDHESCRDHPLITRMNNFYIQWCKASDFDAVDFRNEKGEKITVEGKVTEISYAIKSGFTPPSALQVLRNYETAVKNAGGLKLYQEGNYEIWLKLEKGGQRYWIYVDSWSGGGKGASYLLRIVEEKLMTQEVTVNAESLMNDLQTAGHASVYGIYFDFDKADLNPESEPALREIARLLRENKDLKLYVVGHTDNVGSLDYNMKLSMARAEAVVRELTTKYGISPDRLQAFGLARLAPVASNETEEGRAKNRRVELVKQ